MKKTLMALAVGSAFAAPAAFADVTISGSINMGIEYLNVGSQSDQSAAGNPAGPNDGVGNLGVASNYSNITIASMEDLGGGLKLDFAFQMVAPTQNVDGNGGNGSVLNRNSHIGLVGESWGGVWYGSNENLYERYFYTVDPLDGAAGLGGNLQIMGTPGGAVFSTCGNNSCGYTWYRRDAQAIWYDSPNWNGFTFGAVFQTNYGKTSSPNASTNPNMWQLGAKYVGTTMPLQVWGAYGQRKDQFGLTGVVSGVTAGGVAPPTGTGSKDNAWQLGAGYTLGDIFFFGVYEDIKYKLDGVAIGNTPSNVQDYSRGAFQLGLKWNLASGYVGLNYLQALGADCELSGGGECNADDTGAYSIGLGYYHTMSKQTQLYVVGSWLDNQANANYGTAGIGNSASFQNLGATYWGVGVGIKHSF